jgi:phage repressor protein C with HTH and peptisase S24 domain
MVTHGEILKHLIRSAALTQAEFADKVGVSRVTVGNWTRSAWLPPDKINQIVKTLGISEDVFAKEEINTADVLKNLSNDAETGYQRTGSTILYVPVEAEAGFIGGYTTPVLNHDLKEWSLPGFDERGYSFRVKGDSMFPTFREGEIVVTGQKTEPYELIKKEYVYVIVCSDNILIKRIAINKNEPGKLILISDNPAYPETELNYDEVKLYRARRNISYDLSKKYPVPQ